MVDAKHTELPPLPKGFLVMMSPDPEAMPAEWFDAADMQAYAHQAVAEATSKLNALIGMQHTQLVAAEQRLAAAPQQGWVSVEQALPELGIEVLVWSKQPWEKTPSIKIDTWDEQHEAPLAISSATIAIGPGWNDHDDFYSVIAWTPLLAPPGIKQQASDEGGGG